MALFRDSGPGSREVPPPTPAPAPVDVAPRAPEPAAEPMRRPVEARTEAPSAPRTDAKESFISAELTLEGKIEGAGHVRIAGRFKGDVNVQGDLTIERGATIAGQVSAKQVVVEGTLEGNITSAERVELRQTGMLNGDVKAGTLIVAAGSKMRGHAEFGWGESGAPAKPAMRGVG
jgi:cytoskeletal protein CcmA (bactofilin family)